MTCHLFNMDSISAKGTARWSGLAPGMSSGGLDQFFHRVGPVGFVRRGLVIDFEILI